MKRDPDFRLYVAIVVFAAIVGASVLSCYIKEKGAWDFKVTYGGALAYRMGLNPYDSQVLSTVLHQHIVFLYVYPPDTLFLYRPLTYFSLYTAARIYLTFKLLLVGVLFFLWNRIFGFKQYLFLLFLLAPFAFNGSLLFDLRAGNVSVVEQLFLWFGFYCYTRDKIGWFCAAILLASAFKLTPILFLGLLLTRLRKKDLVALAITATCFLLLLACNALLWPQLFASFFHNVATGTGGARGDDNPTTWALAHDFRSWIALKTGHLLPGLVPLGLYLVASLAALGVAVASFARLRSWEEKEANLCRICLICFLYALIVPRFKNYSYILLIAPSLYLILSRPLASYWAPFCALLLLYTYRHFDVVGSIFSPLFRIESEYYCMLLAWSLAGLFCYSILRPNASGQPHPAREDSA
jgi:hypothetical protein